ncbi:hemocyanin, copper containing domain-containing protein [Phthorimaea operculella]|nr:hemocyanin, copper containing domain-containing protein [Phthorimaea operculella]
MVWVKSNPKLPQDLKEGILALMMLHNGVELTKRTNNYVLIRDDNIDVLRLVDDYEMIIKEAIVKGYIEINGIRMELTKTDDIEMLGRLIYGKVDKMDKMTVDAYRYLLIICKSVLGLNTMRSDKYFVMPTVLDMYQTALRDPVFYMLQKRLCDFVWLFKKRLPSYTKEDLLFPGVKIDKIVVDKMVTYFDDYFMDMTNAVTLTEDEMKKGHSDMKFLVRKRRLNHYPFKVTLDVMSDKAADCVVRIFLGPKEDHMGRVIDINKNGRSKFIFHISIFHGESCSV